MFVLLVLAFGAGLPPVEWRDDVAAVAVDWSGTMASTGVLAHNDYYFSGEMRERLGTSWRSENVAAGTNAADIHAAFMNSPAHRANILDPRSVQGGFGVVMDASGRWWVTEDFMSPRSDAAPAPQPEPTDPTSASQPAPATAPEPVPASEPAPPPTAAPDVPATATTVAPEVIVVEQAAAPAAVVGEPTTPIPAPTSTSSSTPAPPAIPALAAAMAATTLAGHLKVRHTRPLAA